MRTTGILTMAAENGGGGAPRGKRTRRDRRQQRSSASSAPLPTSPLAMGRALVLVATSCAALSATGPAAVRVRCEGERTAAARAVRIRPCRDGGGFASTALFYRRGDEDKFPANQRRRRSRSDGAEDGAALRVDAPTPTAPATQDASRRGRGPSQGFFSVVKLTSLRPAAVASSSAASSSSSKEDEQLDEYIEFYERRYSRLHPRGEASPARRRPTAVLDFRFPRKVFLSTLSLHRPAAPTTAPATAPTPTREEEDALRALGLDDLASPRLRQRLHVPRDLREEHALLANGAHFLNAYVHFPEVHLGDPYAAAASGSAAAKIKTAPSSPEDGARNGDRAGPRDASTAVDGGRAASYASLSFLSQFRLLLATMSRLASSFVATTRILAAFSGRAFAEVLGRGGFRNTVQLAAAASIAVVLMFRPLFRGAMRQG